MYNVHWACNKALAGCKVVGRCQLVSGSHLLSRSIRSHTHELDISTRTQKRHKVQVNSLRPARTFLLPRPSGNCTHELTETRKKLSKIWTFSLLPFFLPFLCLGLHRFLVIFSSSFSIKASLSFQLTSLSKVNISIVPLLSSPSHLSLNLFSFL